MSWTEQDLINAETQWAGRMTVRHKPFPLIMDNIAIEEHARSRQGLLSLPPAGLTQQE
jgi:hypothetical protein